MIDYVSLACARMMKDRPMAPGVKMSGGDSPLWDADMEFWMSDAEEIHKSQHYRSSMSVNSVSGEINGSEYDFEEGLA